jgi:hypothetical protein
MTALTGIKPQQWAATSKGFAVAGSACRQDSRLGVLVPIHLLYSTFPLPLYIPLDV